MDSARHSPPVSAETAERRGRLEVVFERDAAGATFVARQYAGYPYHLCKPHRFEGDPSGMATLYVQSSAGGLFEHDRLGETVRAAAGAAAHVTTQAPTIVHGMSGGEARLAAVVEAEAGSMLEVLPDPFILFPGARLALDLAVRAHETAALLVGESFLAHDPGGEGRAFDRLASTIRIEIEDGEVLALERGAVYGHDFLAGRPGLLGRFRCLGTMLWLQRGRPVRELLEAARAALGAEEGVYAGATALPRGVGIVLRYLAEDGLALRRVSEAAWAAWRRVVVGATASPRRK
jgi:urease accessory protein